MTTNINEVEFWELETEDLPTIDDMIDDELEAEVSGYAAVIKERYQDYRRWCEIADNGGMCRCCLIRKMATENDLGYGEGYCTRCVEQALEMASFISEVQQTRADLEAHISRMDAWKADKQAAGEW